MSRVKSFKGILAARFYRVLLFTAAQNSFVSACLYASQPKSTSNLLFASSGTSKLRATARPRPFFENADHRILKA